MRQPPITSEDDDPSTGEQQATAQPEAEVPVGADARATTQNELYFSTVQDQAHTDRLIQLRRAEAALTIEKEQAATENYVRRTDADAAAQERLMTAHGQQSRRTMTVAGFLIVAFLVTAALCCGPVIEVVSLHARFFRVRHSTALWSGGSAFSVVGAALSAYWTTRRRISRLTGRPGADPSTSESARPQQSSDADLSE